MYFDESPAAELWRRTLSQIPTVFGRLVYLSKLRDPISGIYEHHGFAQRFTPGEAQKTMHRSHTNLFSDWLCFSLEQQKKDVGRYLDSLENDREAIMHNWSVSPPFANLIPHKTGQAERELFLSDMKAVFEVLSSEYSAALPVRRGASPRR